MRRFSLMAALFSLVLLGAGRSPAMGEDVRLVSLFNGGKTPELRNDTGRLEGHVAMQLHGGAGVSEDFPLAAAYAGARALRLADGPDEVHLGVVARRLLKPYVEAARG